MNATRLSFLLLAAALVWAGISGRPTVAGTQPPATVAVEALAPAGPHQVQILTDIWIDTARADRAVPVKIYYPADGQDPAPVVIVSHGLGGSRDGLAYFGRHLASCGYIAVHLTHTGSDTEALLAAMGQTTGAQAALQLVAAKPANFINRPKDVSFAITHLLELNQTDGPLRSRIDPERIGVAGHSFGAYTAMAVAGEHFFPQSGQEVNLGDARVKAAVVMSPPARNPEARQFARITIPLLLMTGTLDQSPIGSGGGPEQRRQIFTMLTGCDHYLVVFTGGDHLAFDGKARVAAFAQLPGTNGDPAMDATFQALVKKSSQQFFDAYLKNDQACQRWLTADDGAQADLGGNGTWSAKRRSATTAPAKGLP